MPEPTPTPQFEEEIRTTLQTPPARPEFVSRLQSQLLQAASAPVTRSKRPFFLRPAWAAAFVLALILVAAALIVGPERIVSAFGSLFGYLPGGIGLVHLNGDGSLLMLEAPVQVEREGITLKVEQGAADSTHTVLIYHVEGLSLKAANSQGELAPTGGPMVLLLPDGSFLSMTEASMRGWGTGFQTRLVFPALPAGVNEATLLIYRLETMPAGVAPEDWRIPLSFKPAPPDLKVMPVYELSAATATTGPSAAVATLPVPSNQSVKNGITLNLDKVAELDDGYVLQGSVSWDAQQYADVMLDLFFPGSKFLTDGNGQPIPYAMTEDGANGAYQGPGSKFTWALRTKGKAFPGPWTLAIPTMGVDQDLNADQAAFQFDFGPNPQVGQTWQLDQEIEVAGYKLHLTSASLGTNSRTKGPQIAFNFEASGEVSFTLAEADPATVTGSGLSRTGTQVEARLYYVTMPTGVHTIHLTSISYPMAGPWQVSWNPPTANQALSNQSSLKGITFSLDKVIEEANGYQLQGSATWDRQQYISVMFSPNPPEAQLTDAKGQNIPFAMTEEGVHATGSTATWALRTDSKAYPGSWTLTIPSVQVVKELSPDQAAFQLDFGSDPQVGQTWRLDQELNLAGYKVRLVSASVEQDSRSQNPKVNFVFDAPPDIVDITGVFDPANMPDVSGTQPGATGGGGASGPGQFTSYIIYPKMPTGVHTLQINAIFYTLAGPWQVSWDAPATGLPAPTQAPAACFNTQTWQQIQNQTVAVPAGVNGRLLLETNTGQLMPQLSVLNTNGSGRKEIAIGGWSALSPDGTTVAFIKSNGPSLFLAGVASGEVRPVPNSTAEDYHPVWSPDGQWLAFVRSLEGVYVIHLDGTGLKQVADYTGVPAVVGFLPGSQRLVITVLGADGSQFRIVDIQTGQVENLFTIDNAKGGFGLLSPDGTHLAFSEGGFGMTYGIYVAALDGSNKRLVAELDGTLGTISATAWSPDGKWLALSVDHNGSGAQVVETPILLNLDTCQAYPLPGLEGRIASWTSFKP